MFLGQHRKGYRKVHVVAANLKNIFLKDHSVEFHNLEKNQIVDEILHFFSILENLAQSFNKVPQYQFWISKCMKYDIYHLNVIVRVLQKIFKTCPTNF